MHASGREFTLGVDDEPQESIALREATLLCSFEDIRRLHRFMSDIVAMIDAGTMREEWAGHEHLRDRDADWTDEEADLIIAWEAPQS